MFGHNAWTRVLLLSLTRGASQTALMNESCRYSCVDGVESININWSLAHQSKVPASYTHSLGYSVLALLLKNDRSVDASWLAPNHPRLPIDRR